MALVIEPVKRMRIYVEPNGSFAVAGSIGSFLACPFVEGSATVAINRPLQTPGHSQAHMDGYPTEVFMPKRARLDFTVNLETVTARSSGAGASVIAQGALGALLRVALGGETLGTGTTVNDASPSTTLNTLTTVTGIAEGTAIGFNTGTGGTLEIREVKDKTGSDVTVKHALTAAPANGADVAASATYYLHGTIGSQTESLQVAYEGLFTGDRFLLSGGKLASPPKFALAPGGIPTIAWSWEFATWSQTDNDGGATGTLTANTYLNAVTLVHFDSEFRHQTVGTSAIGTLIHESEVMFDPAVAYDWQISSAGTNNIVQSIRTRVAPVVRGSFVCPFEDSTWITARDNRTAKDLMLQIGTSVSVGGILIVAPNVQITDVQIEKAAINSQRVSWVGRLDTDTTGTTNLHQSAFRVHLI